MTREEILKAYTVNDRGLITSPGKFEGEMIYAPHFYALMMDDGADEDLDDGSFIFHVTDEDRTTFPEIGATKRIWLGEEDNGFVRVFDADA